jgi:hypothetical protein
MQNKETTIFCNLNKIKINWMYNFIFGTKDTKGPTMKDFSTFYLLLFSPSFPMPTYNNCILIKITSVPQQNHSWKIFQLQKLKMKHATTFSQNWLLLNCEKREIKVLIKVFFL